LLSLREAAEIGVSECLINAPFASAKGGGEHSCGKPPRGHLNTAELYMIEDKHFRSEGVQMTASHKSDFKRKT